MLTQRTDSHHVLPVLLWTHISCACQVHANLGSVCIPISTPIIPAVKSMTTPKPSLKSTSQRLACLQAHFLFWLLQKYYVLVTKNISLLPLHQDGYFLTILQTSMPADICNIIECHILSVFPTPTTNKTQNFTTICNNKIISLHCL